MYIPIVSFLGFLLLIILRLYYKFLKGGVADEICKHNITNATGLLNILNVITGATAWRCNKHAFTTLAWLPLFYIEMTRGRAYTLLLILHLITTSFALPQLKFIYEGYSADSVVKQLSNCCSSYTYNYIMGAFYMNIAIEVYQNADAVHSKDGHQWRASIGRRFCAAAI